MGDTWKAVADSSRRQILLLLKDGEKTPSEIAGNFEFTLPALSTHLRVLREADLVGERRAGQKRYYSINKQKMTEMMRFFDEFWDESIYSLKHHAESRK